LTQCFSIHPTHPQARLIKQAAEQVRQGALMATPSDACYVLACHLDDKRAVDRLRALRGLDDKHLLTLMCADLSQLATYAQVDNAQYRYLKQLTPGPFTFILNATRETPRRLWHPSRKTIGMRVPSDAVLHAVLSELAEPLLCASLILPGDTEPLHEAEEIVERLKGRLDLVLDAGGQGFEPTTVIDLTGPEPLLVRQGRGQLINVS
jgi:tRNA threonylcarbamoyl adenosine modification protein (Sua5/YciO/YrdC/YwlC family)